MPEKRKPRSQQRAQLYENAFKRTTTRQQRRGLDVDDAQDTAQSAILIALEKKIEQNGEDALMGYVDKTARNKLIDLARRNKMKGRRHVPIKDESTFSLHESVLPERETIHREQKAAIRKAIRSLGEEFQEIMLLVMDGYTNEEIAQITKTNPVTVRTRINRARTKLREQLELFK